MLSIQNRAHLQRKLPFPNDFVLEYLFNGSATETKTGLSGTVGGATLTTNRKGVANSAYEFDGINDYIDISNVISVIENNTAGSISIWLQKGGATYIDPGAFVFSADGSDGDFLIAPFFFETAGGIYARGRDDLVFERRYSGIDGLNDLLWHHIVVGSDGANHFAYFDGVEITLTPNISSGNPTVRERAWFNDILVSAINIGRQYLNASTARQHFLGKIDDIRVYDRKLNDNEVLALYFE